MNAISFVFEYDPKTKVATIHHTTISAFIQKEALLTGDPTIT